MSFYEEKKREILSSPFDSLDDRHKYETSLDEWLQQHRNRPVPTSPSVLLLRDLRSTCSERDILNVPPRTLIAFKAPIQTVSCTAIVNAANESLLGGGGIDFAIHDAAGSLLLRECAQFPHGCNVGEAVITKGYDLPSAVVIHTVGPLLKDDAPDDDGLARCYHASLKLCDEHKIEDVVFPGISTGFYGFPWPRATKVAVRAVLEYFERNPTSTVKLAGFCGFEESHVNLFRNAFDSVSGC